MKRGKLLDEAIEDELQLMLAEGFESSPISHKSLHDRLISKKIVSGGLSTLSTIERKNIIAHYIGEQLSPLKLKPREKQQYVNGKTRDALMSKNAQLQTEIVELKGLLTKNTISLVNIINAVSMSTSIRVERLIAPHIIREIRNKESVKNEVQKIKKNDVESPSRILCNCPLD